MGVWLPLALGSIMCFLENALRREGDQPTRLSDVIGRWALPATAEAVKALEDEAEADRTIANFNALAERFGGVKVRT